MQNDESVVAWVSGLRLLRDAENRVIDEVAFWSRECVYRIIHPCRDRRVGDVVFQQVLEEVRDGG